MATSLSEYRFQNYYPLNFVLTNQKNCNNKIITSDVLLIGSSYVFEKAQLSLLFNCPNVFIHWFYRLRRKFFMAQRPFTELG